LKRILLVSILVLSLVLVSTGCASSSSDESKIKDTVNKFFDAISDGDYEQMFDYAVGGDQMTQEQKDAAVQLLKQFMPSGVEIKVKTVDDVKVTGDTATASIVITIGGTDSPAQNLNFKKEDGSWKIDYPLGG
jgi:ketosteroid isomerase-like protein